MKWNAEDEVCYHYTIERFLGAGGMGEVYHAFHKVTRREVAIKAIREHWKDQSEYPMMHDRFSKEATIWTRLPRSPNIVEAIEFFPDFQGDPYLILEFIDGANLKAFLEREKRIDCLQAIRYAIDFCTGMEAAVLEKRPIIHRDISHDNVLISKAGNTLKVNDFGLAMTGVLNPRLLTGAAGGARCTFRYLFLRADIPLGDLRLPGGGGAANPRAARAVTGRFFQAVYGA